MDKIIHILILFLSRRQSERFITNLFASLATFLVKFRRVIFLENNTYCYDLAKEVLQLCNSPSPVLRDNATGFLYSMAKHNFLAAGNCVRLSVATTIHLSKFTDDTYIKHALETFTQYAIYEYSMTESFFDTPTQNDILTINAKIQFAKAVEELSETSTKILKDSTAITDVIKYGDSDLIAEVYFRIAQRYVHTPSMRISYLESLGTHHIKKSSQEIRADRPDLKGTLIEAGLCYTHIAALVANYLKTLGQLGDVDLSALRVISPHIEEFVDLSDDSSADSNLFNEETVIKKAEYAAKLFEQANMWELANEIYKLILAIHEKNYNYQKMSLAHAEIVRLFQSLLTNEVRFFGNYFRVGFYGSKFDYDFDGKEFVYKDAQLTHLFELAERLKKFFGSKVGEGNILTWPDSGKVDRSKMDPSKCYLQITHLEPYFEPDELRGRKTPFQRNHNLARFYYTTPFTKGGKAQGTTAEQHKMKTIITVEGSFPSMLRRLPIISKKEIIMDPLDCALDMMEERISVLQTELTKAPPNPKTLQQVLQGSARPQVNAGASEICKVFLGDDEELWSPDRIDFLRKCLTEFLQKCWSAIELNETLIAADQVPFQQEMKVGYEALVKDMSPYIEKKITRSPTIGDTSLSGYSSATTTTSVSESLTNVTSLRTDDSTLDSYSEDSTINN